MLFTTRVRAVVLAMVPFALALLTLGPAAAFAAPGNPAKGENVPLDLPAEDGPTQLDTVGSGGGSLVRTIVGLAIVIGVIYGLAWVLRQMKASKEERTTGSGLRPAATIALGPNRSLHLVHAGRELVLVGVAEHGVTPIRTYSEEEARELGLIDDEDDDATPPTRGGLFGGGGLPAPGGSAATRGQQVIEALRRRTVR